MITKLATLLEIITHALGAPDYKVNSLEFLRRQSVQGGMYLYAYDDECWQLYREVLVSFLIPRKIVSIFGMEENIFHAFPFKRWGFGSYKFYL